MSVYTHVGVLIGEDSSAEGVSKEISKGISKEDSALMLADSLLIFTYIIGSLGEYRPIFS